jgi:hypothetical protein
VPASGPQRLEVSPDAPIVSVRRPHQPPGPLARLIGKRFWMDSAI